MPEKLMFVLIVLLVATLTNSVSFTIVRALNPRRFPRDCELVTLREAAPGEAVNFLIPGAFERPEVAFGFIMDDLPGGIVAARCRKTGWSAKEIADQIYNRIMTDTQHPFRIITIAVGDSVARYLERAFGEYPEVQLEVIAIDPCPNFLMLENRTIAAAQNYDMLVRPGRYLLGWLSVKAMPFLRAQGGNYSLAALADWIDQATSMEIIENVDNTIAVVVSQNDERLSKVGIEDFFQYARVIEVLDAAHADTIRNAQAYREAMLRALQDSFF